MDKYHEIKTEIDNQTKSAAYQPKVVEMQVQRSEMKRNSIEVPSVSYLQTNLIEDLGAEASMERSSAVWRMDYR